MDTLKILRLVGQLENEMPRYYEYDIKTLSGRESPLEYVTDDMDEISEIISKLDDILDDLNALNKAAHSEWRVKAPTYKSVVEKLEKIQSDILNPNVDEALKKYHSFLEKIDKTELEGIDYSEYPDADRIERNIYELDGDIEEEIEHYKSIQEDLHYLDDKYVPFVESAEYLIGLLREGKWKDAKDSIIDIKDDEDYDISDIENGEEWLNKVDDFLKEIKRKGYMDK